MAPSGAQSGRLELQARRKLRLFYSEWHAIQKKSANARNKNKPRVRSSHPAQVGLEHRCCYNKICPEAYESRVQIPSFSEMSISLGGPVARAATRGTRRVCLSRRRFYPEPSPKREHILPHRQCAEARPFIFLFFKSESGLWVQDSR